MRVSRSPGALPRMLSLAIPLAIPLACLAVCGSAVAEDAVTLEEVSVTGEGRGFGAASASGSATSVIENPVGQIVTSVGREAIANRPATSIGSVLLDSPGVTVRQGNGARDVVISIAAATPAPPA